jgi:hypothetical protein
MRADWPALIAMMHGSTILPIRKKSLPPPFACGTLIVSLEERTRDESFQTVYMGVAAASAEVPDSI